MSRLVALRWILIGYERYRTINKLYELHILSSITWTEDCRDVRCSSSLSCQVALKSLETVWQETLRKQVQFHVTRLQTSQFLRIFKQQEKPLADRKRLHLRTTEAGKPSKSPRVTPGEQYQTEWERSEECMMGTDKRSGTFQNIWSYCGCSLTSEFATESTLSGVDVVRDRRSWASLGLLSGARCNCRLVNVTHSTIFSAVWKSQTSLLSQINPERENKWKSDKCVLLRVCHRDVWMRKDISTSK